MSAIPKKFLRRARRLQEQLASLWNEIFDYEGDLQDEFDMKDEKWQESARWHKAQEKIDEIGELRSDVHDAAERLLGCLWEE